MAMGYWKAKCWNDFGSQFCITKKRLLMKQFILNIVPLKNDFRVFI